MKYTGCIFIVFYLALSIIPVSLVKAQNEEASHAIREGTRAFQFGISDNFNLTSFSGTTFSYKWHKTAEKANRIGLSFRNDYDTTDLPDNENERQADRLDIDLFTRYTWMTYTNPESDIKHYFGYGPGLSFRHNSIKRDRTDTDTIISETGVGMHGIAYTGVEWFFHPSMSLHAEFVGSVQMNVTWRKDTREDRQAGGERENRQRTLALGLGDDGVRFGISVYF